MLCDEYHCLIEDDNPETLIYIFVIILYHVTSFSQDINKREKEFSLMSILV